MKDNLKALLWLALGLVSGLAMVYLHCKLHGPAITPDGTVITRLVLTDTITDTVPVTVMRDSVAVRYVTATLPVVRGDTAAVAEAEKDSAADSAKVSVPITQAVYRRDSLYTAWVSGYRPRLDSIKVYPRREVTVIKQPPGRLHLGVTVGYGMTPRGPQPYLGVGLTYGIIGF